MPRSRPPASSRWMSCFVLRWRTNVLRTLLEILAALALALARVGVYGVLTYAVAQRTHEIGVRMALGAQRADVLRLLARQALQLLLPGVVVGLLGALALTRLMQGLLFNVSATDPLTFAAVAALLVIVALLAFWIPARRATKIAPLIALKCA
jgi:putative ABC transport system permease protein